MGAEVMLAEPVSGLVHVLNPTTAAVWNALLECRTVAEIAAHVRASMTVPEGLDLDAVVQRALQILESKGLVRYT